MGHETSGVCPQGSLGCSGACSERHKHVSVGQMEGEERNPWEGGAYISALALVMAFSEAGHISLAWGRGEQ